MTGSELLDSIDLLGGDTQADASSVATTTIAKGSPAAPAVQSDSSAFVVPRPPRLTLPQQPIRGALYFDLETVPDESRMAAYELAALPQSVKRATVAEMGDDLPSVLLAKSIDKITEILDAKCPCDEFLDALEAMEKTQKKGGRDGVFKLIKRIREIDGKLPELTAARNKEMALSPEMNRIVAMGWSIGGDDPESLVVGVDKATEADILCKFWSLAQHATRLIGFNIAGFDLPTIYVRSMLLGVEPTRQFDVRPWGTDIIDLMTARFPRGGMTKGQSGLKWLCKVMGIPVPAGDVDGSHVGMLFREGRLAEIGEYVRSDISLVIDLHRVYRGFFCS